ncbi:MAG: hypothetical protein HY537_01710 [Deltaproteobacteria bacterium]|nr:hypothetical protein [Deltaproteobacteria bacterium]
MKDFKLYLIHMWECIEKIELYNDIPPVKKKLDAALKQYGINPKNKKAPK